MSSQAATTTFNMTTSVTVVKTCKISAPSMNFGNKTKIVATDTASTNVSVTCSAGTPYNISFSPTFAMTSGIGTLTGPGGNLQFQATLATSAGTGTASHVMNGQMIASPITTQGLYQNTFLIYVNY
ncbi:MAG: spore coat protein U domain-containing protein [Alphaproteobacteria bacterium]|nr:spore coat protein U domain-containing protein [Alphaproteobacteria bacterium]